MKSADLREGLVGGSILGMMCSVFAIIAWVAGGPEAFDDVGMNLGTVVLFYLSGGVLVGVVYGLLAPLTRSGPGAAFVGVVIAFFLCSGAAIVLPELDVREVETWVLVGLASIFFGAAGGLFAFDPRTRS